VSYLFQAKLITKIDITKIDISQIEMKGRKKTSDASKRLRGTDQPCRMDGELVPMAPASRARVAAMIAGIQKKDDFADFETVDEQ